MEHYDVVIIGAGFTGLTAAYVLSKQGYRVRVIEVDDTPGGLAGTFEFADGVRLEKFYHHWFNNDLHVPELVKELGMQEDIITLPSRTGMYFNGRMWKLSTPMDLLRFKALSFIDRIRLGLLVFQVRKVKNWQKIEHLTIREWLEPLCGKNVYRTVWEPLITSKFSLFAEEVSAVWFWKKLLLRGSTRDKKGGEELAYFKGGFGRLAEAMVKAIHAAGGTVSFNEKVISVNNQDQYLSSVTTNQGVIGGKQFLFTPAFSIIANLFEGTADPIWIERLRRVKYLGNLCLVLRLKESLSNIYWTNVNDPGFPFVGVIEHTNFDSPDNYRGTHIAFLSRYLAVEDPLWNYSDEQYLEFALQHLKRMFPKLDRSWILEYKLWRAEYAQPVTERNYSQYLPNEKTPYSNAWISTMAHIYPEDRGTNYAIREGRNIAEKIRLGLLSTPMENVNSTKVCEMV
ncbi:NAD(P)/FAD-dependent oxidoreductase [Legionella anisa]|uniref:FAD-dependent oxidoreductase n=1 Tax=Legionella anisa TaxID=28082 RepID=A0AAX0WUS3_9GAMM|nr:NAD(P)/FAD-dependent oxidoreductase [Legionella anisa]AWN73955.1 FAD-dependent oxidoreductase [Legionella anisa]KTC67226.1 15-cis-phytoene desaturase [Legionella anisa]MCW8426029.1 NAD(P)/FAD-dependent oxidoreductase [Legionella anisa]MCW8448537.1 NAD(P)/FAD-dependent oxidoreductase [Legionella anisa]PNL62142.1 FAD-dependent oxidoreductase [Legionella anisa]